jgi:hypothetical protein
MLRARNMSVAAGAHAKERCHSQAEGALSDSRHSPQELVLVEISHFRPKPLEHHIVEVPKQRAHEQYVRGDPRPLDWLAIVAMWESKQLAALLHVHQTRA